ncbi:MAG: hypothetical protein LC117_05155 [Bacteroidia bacterium]|nr:hypothetical protein [Bacteroidia bacterium]MCZ2277299.1 hypothetical protein [Bacteroidia bacterium]
MKQLIWFIILVVYGCHAPHPSEKALEAKLDSLQELVRLLVAPEQNRKVDSVALKTDTGIVLSAKIKKPDTLPVKIKKSNAKPQTIVTDNEIQQFFYKSTPKRLSVEISSWVDQKRTLRFFNPKGEETYTIEDVRKSYSSVSRIEKMHDNGACKLVEISFNPGASMYWYETEIIFDEDNVPLWKTETQLPEMSSAQSLNNKWWWNKSENKWIRQESVLEQPVPDSR